ncbi:hypothetical protein [Pseudomonas viridiflava]|jgi:hypothetical protein|uniref:hypothetical protein n=1 Tax=Pseudomonas viridiflava TaxID=33069 RepID=UPI000F030595|nr:hypothetical protein [Pseudomonas viridiflava]
MSGSTATLEWHYHPADLFSDAQTVEAYGASVTMQEGIARADLDETLYKSDASLTSKLLRVIRARLAPYERQRTDPVTVTTPPTLTITHSDGRAREIHLECYASLRVTDSMEIQIFHKGVLIHDSEQERRDRLLFEAELLSKHAEDDLLGRLLGSHSESKRDPGDEFTHLYEILEALQARFGKPPKLTSVVGIEKTKVGRFHAVCNDPSTVSRHRGQTKGPLRVPTAEEFSFARTFAWEMIMSYADWLERQPA